MDLRRWYLSGAGATINEGCDDILTCETEEAENERECWGMRGVIGAEYFVEESDGDEEDVRDLCEAMK